MTVDWRRPLIYTHRWLGIVGGVFFFMWFGTGIVMMYARMPSLSNAERLAKLRPLDLERATISPADAARVAGVIPEECRLAMLGDRPVYRFLERGRAATVFADTGEPLTRMTPDVALEVARPFVRDGEVPTIPEGALLEDADQWTFSVRRAVPLYRVSLDTEQDAMLYVSAQTGEAVMKTGRADRRWAYLGAVLHWLYFTSLRRRAAFWAQSVIWLSLAGCVLSLSGLAWGLWRYARTPRYRLKGVPSRSPYAGLMRWHHYAGLIFGLATFTWIFSGLLSMDPLAWSPDTSPTVRQREGVSGGPLHLDDLTVERLQASAAAFAPSFEVKELGVVQFQGRLFLAGADHGLVEPLAPASNAFTRFSDDAMLEAARAAMPGADVESADWLNAYDAYYYDREREAALPVLRVRYLDEPRTWLYLDPQSGTIAHKEERLSRLNRWLYHGLHSLDFPFLYYRRPLWDVVVIGLSIGGLVLSLTTMPVGWHRLRRHATRVLRNRQTARHAGRQTGGLVVPRKDE